MNKYLKEYTREELEKKLLHVTNYAANKLATEFIEITEPLAKVIRTPEAEIENTHRVLELIALIFPAWDLVEKTHPGYEYMRDWVAKNHATNVSSCVCSGCKEEDQIVN